MRRWCAIPVVLYMVALALLPGMSIVVCSFLKRDVYGGVFREGSLEAWTTVFEFSGGRLLLRSLVMAGAVTLSCLAIAYPAALAMVAMPRRRRNLFVALVGFPMVMSNLLRIYGWTNLLPVLWRGTNESVALVMVGNYVPFVLLPLLRSLEQIDATLPQAAMDLGANRFQTFWRVMFPLSRSGMISGGALVFVPCCGEYLVPHFIGAGKVRLLGTQVVQEFTERRNWPYAAALAVCLLSLIFAPLVFSLATKDLPNRLQRGDATEG